MKQLSMWQTTANAAQTCLTWNNYPYVANNSKWHTNMFDMKQLSICGKQQQMTHKHVSHETVIHMWQTTANETQTCLTWDSYPYVKKRQQMTQKHFWHETVVHMWQTTANDIQACLTWNSYPYVVNNSKWHKSIFDMKQLSICGKQQQMTYKHVCHETILHVANKSKWHTSIFDMKQLSICG